MSEERTKLFNSVKNLKDNSHFDVKSLSYFLKTNLKYFATNYTQQVTYAENIDFIYSFLGKEEFEKGFLENQESEILKYVKETEQRELQVKKIIEDSLTKWPKDLSVIITSYLSCRFFQVRSVTSDKPRGLEFNKNSTFLT